MRKKPVVYIPPGAKINIDNARLLPPEVEYEKRRVVFDVDAVKDLAKGQCGKKDN